VNVERYERGPFAVSTDPARLDLEAIHAYLASSYWAEGIPLDTVRRSVENSLCFGLYGPEGQIGLARVITDQTTYAYLCDVFVLAEYRGEGLGRWLIECVMGSPRLQGLRRWMLVTRNAHGLYQPVGFRATANPGGVMEIVHPGIYRRAGEPADRSHHGGLTADRPIPATQPVLATSRLILRPFRAEDAAAVRRLAGAREVADTTLTIPHPYPEGVAEAWIAGQPAAWAAGAGAVWAVTRRSDGELVGAVGLVIEAEHARAELGYWIAVPEWNRGYGTEAARAAVNAAFELLKLNRVEAYHFARNPASGRVLDKAGMRREGVRRGAVRKWGRFEDLVQYAVTAADRTVPGAG
jgi:ribosomal-protein-alanine N-acetyltransferase